MPTSRTLSWCALGSWLATGCPSGSAPEQAAPIEVMQALGRGDIEGYARALEVRPFEFPADHGPHPEFRNEWWYVTGNLENPSGRAFGFELTIFRTALEPLEPSEAPRTSPWATQQMYMAHFAFTDVEAEQFQADDRLVRGAVGLAGAELDPLRIWTGDWSIEGLAYDPLRLELHAGEGSVEVELELRAQGAPILQGDRGLSQKGPQRGNASYYYSYPRLQATGRLRDLGGETHEVTGEAWLDREWSTSVLSEDQEGWDWFALQLSDERELMLYQLRRTDGTPDRFSSGTLVDEDRSVTHLEADDFSIEVLDRWTSPRTGITYPNRWILKIPREDLELEVIPKLAEQELDLLVQYWEGAVDVRGRGPSSALSGQGYVELTGYGPDRPER